MVPGWVWRVSAYWPGGVRHGGGASPICGVRAEQEKARPDERGVLADRPVVVVNPL